MMNCEECCDRCEAHECICIECKGCGEQVPPDDLFNGICSYCEDVQMVRGIV